ncbi:hypothetical protein M4D49_29080 [Cupriavidus pauculus]|uniref:type IV CRISPR-associated protein Csf1 n=1 Tax=Cupriavidus TaxID=106589 RepID=UPI00049373EE|nr:MULTISPECIES: type IV CRISPR-associated protein Csf1 [Cupriavidus]MCM3609532.1 hypothetical protein [Cupriavidus pauculus]
MSEVAYGSELACRAIGREPKGTFIAQEAGACAMCGRRHETGESVVPFQPQASFTDWTALRAPASQFICKWCDAVWDRDFTQTYLKTIVCEAGVFPAASNDHLAYWIMNPPEGRWLFLQGDQKIQHVVWRAPVNRSREVFQVRAGESVLTIRSRQLHAGLAAVKGLAAKATELRGVKRGAPFKSPFISLSRDLDSPSQGVLRRELYAHAAEDPLTAQNIAIVGALTGGELWALTSILYAKNPHRPEPLSIKE